MEDIKTLGKRTKKDADNYIAAQDATIHKLQQDNKLLQEKVSHLESLLVSSVSRAMSTPEELICIEQIAIIKQKSSGRELSLDEVKRLDILIKNLRLIQNQSTETFDHKDYRNVKEAELVAIARKSDEEDTE